MLRTPVWATASLLAVAISLAGCGEDTAPAEQAAAPQAATAQSEPAPAAQETANSEAAQAVVKHYADIAHAVFSEAHSAALKLQDVVDALLLANPTEETLQAAKAAWIAARIPYMQSEVFRFGNPVVDDWEGQLNAWPLDEGMIDYVKGDYQHALGNPGATATVGHWHDRNGERPYPVPA